MYLKTLQLQNFRSFGKAEILFSQNLTVFVGENNGGKSNAIDAIRLLTSPLSGRRELYCETTDIRFGSADPRFELQGTFVALSPAQQGRLLSAAADPTLETAMFGLVYDESTGAYPNRPSIWAGHLKGVPEPGSLQMVRHVYLPPLRDARRALASGNPTRIYSLLQHFLGDEDPEMLAKRLGRAASSEILTKVDEAVDAGLEALTAGVRRQAASLGFATNEKLIDIARDLRFKLADHEIPPQDLRYSGHGYANLLYIATIAVELEKANTADLTIFLVEEPEAHLHPQLQAAVLSFLQDQAAKPKPTSPEYHGPAGDLQIVVATHSPNLSAWVEGRKLVVFTSAVEPPLPAPEPTPQPGPSAAQAPRSVPMGPMKPPPGPPAARAPRAAPMGLPPRPPAPPGSQSPRGTDTDDPSPAEVPTPTAAGSPPENRRATRCLPLCALGLAPVIWRKIDRYLDVTKSALLFGGRVLLVEGIAEALLLPTIARKHVLKDKPRALSVFRSAVFVPIDGVDFEPYVRLLLTPFSDVRIAERVVVVTDGDAGNLEDGQMSPGQVRKAKLDAIAAELEAADRLDAIINTYSLESELVRAGNAALMKGVYLALHPKSEAKWESAVAKEGDAQAVAIQSLFSSTSKGDFAQILADRIDQGDELNTPDYVAAAIQALIR